jgi:radical SAM protein (TIGR01212 family)
VRRQTQREKNQFPFSDTNKRYHTFDYYLRTTYGGKCAIVPLDCGMTCPNIDGTKGYGGCIYCSGRGSGDFAGDAALPLLEQYLTIRERIREKWDCTRFIPYLQAHTNTYAAADRLRRIFSELLMLPGAVAIHIATRADCIDRERARLLHELSEKRDVTVELGLQSISDSTAERINRCHTYSEFLKGYACLREHAPRVRICIHLINGLPGEGKEQMLASAKEVGRIGADEIKIHLLHVLRGTRLAEMYRQGEYHPMEREDYIDTVVEQLTLLPPNCVIGRLTGDGAPDSLLAPDWSRKKLTVINDIDKALFERDLYQGINCSKER